MAHALHHELRTLCSVSVRSCLVRGGEYDGTVLDLPSVDDTELGQALPRSLTAPVTWDWPAETAPAEAPVPVGTIRPSETDHRSSLLAEYMVRFWAQASHEFFGSLGFTPEFTSREQINRVLVEVRLTWYDNSRAGDRMTVASRLSSTGRKTMEVTHLLQPFGGGPTAVVEQTALAVNLQTRRAVELPDFLR